MEGKHFKEEDRIEERLNEIAEPETVEMKADIPADDYYKARIRQLESELMSLNREVHALEDREEKLNGVIEELREALTELEKQNDKLKEEIIRRVMA